MNTNCGYIDFSTLEALANTESFVNEHIKIVGEPTLTKKTIPYFHETICSWAYNVPLKFHWVLVIYPHNKKYLLQQISGIGARYENKDWDMFDSAISTTYDSVQSTIGCIFAQGVVLPGEDTSVDYAGITEGSKRGFINAPIVNGRANFQPLEVGFLDTNRSFVDGFLRPWSIIVAHKGLIAARSTDKDIKADIVVHQLARNGTDRDSKIRKSFLFKNCAPINISGETLDYASSSDFPKLQAKFVFTDYSVYDADTNTPATNDGLNNPFIPDILTNERTVNTAPIITNIPPNV